MDKFIRGQRKLSIICKNTLCKENADTWCRGLLGVYYPVVIVCFESPQKSPLTSDHIMLMCHRVSMSGDTRGQGQPCEETLTLYFLSSSNLSSNFRIFFLRLWILRVSCAGVRSSRSSSQDPREELRRLWGAQGGALTACWGARGRGCGTEAEGPDSLHPLE